MVYYSWAYYFFGDYFTQVKLLFVLLLFFYFCAMLSIRGMRCCCGNSVCVCEE